MTEKEQKYLPEISDKVIEKSFEVANKIVCDVLEKYPEHEDPKREIDAGCVIFGLFSNSVELLHELGWTIGELAVEVKTIIEAKEELREDLEAEAIEMAGNEKG